MKRWSIVLGLVLVVSYGWSQLSMAQDGGGENPASRPTTRPATGGPITAELAERLGMEVVPVTLDMRALDATTPLSKRHESGDSHSSLDRLPIPGAQIFVHAIGSNGNSERLDTFADENGNFSIDIGLRFKGTEIKLYAVTTEAIHASHPLEAGEPTPTELSFYRISSDPALLVQTMNRVVTEQHLDDGRTLIHVRQIVQIQNQTFSVFIDHEAGGYVFPIPEGATLVDVRVNGQAVPGPVATHIKGWGHGVPIVEALYPAGSSGRAGLMIMGTYTFEAPVEDRLVLGFSSPVRCESFTVALEHKKFTMGEDSQLGAVNLGQVPGVSQQMDGYEVTQIPANASVIANVVHGAPPIPAGAWWVIVSVALGLIFAVLVGVSIAKNRRSYKGGANRAESGVEDLDLQLARGEISIEAYESKKRGLDIGVAAVPGGAPVAKLDPRHAEWLAELSAIAARTDASPDVIADDVRRLARIIRDQMQGDAAQVSGPRSESHVRQGTD